jgi:hypothetical protein
VLPEFTTAATVVQNLSPPTALQDSKTWRESVVVDELTEFGLAPSLRTEPIDTRLVPRDGVARHKGLDLHFEKLLRN